MDANTFLDARLAESQVALFYLGQEGFLIKYKELYLLIDPYLSDYVDQNCCSETVQWVRRYPAPICPDILDFVDYVFCTHGHYDHADPETLGKIANVNAKAKFIAPAPIQDALISYGIAPNRIVDAIADEPIAINGCTVVPVPSAHEELHTDENGHYAELGYKFLLGDISIYHGGDCCIYDGLAQRLMGVDILMVPVNGRSYYKRYVQDIIGNMTCEEAIILAKQVNAGMIVPMHYDLYDINRINPAEFVDCLFATDPMRKFHMFVPGECYIFQK